MMADAKYVLCRWEKRLWPAKVLARTETSTKNKRKKEYFLDVQILSLEEKIKVKSTEVEILEKSQIEAIASSLASQSEVPAAPLEELAYRRSLRVALDVLSEGPIWSQESSPGTGRADQSLREKPTEHVSSPCDSNFSSIPRGDVLGSSGPHRRRQCVQQSLSSSFTCEKDPECKADHKKGLRKSENPRGLSVLSAGGGAQDESGSRIHRKNWTLASKRGRNSVQKSSLCRNGSSLSEGDVERDMGSKGGSWAAPSSPSGVREDDPCANAEGRDPGLPLGSLTVLPAPEPSACSEPRERPAKKRLRLDGSQRPPAAQLEPRAAGDAPAPGPGPRESMTLRSTTRLGPPPSHASVDETRRPPCPDSQKLEEDCQSSEASMGPNSVRSVLEEDEEDEEPPRVLLYHGSPVRKSIQQDAPGTRFPQLSKGSPEEPVVGPPLGQRQPCRKVLPDRSRAARDRANQKLVEYIVKAKGAESHLRAILKSRKPSRWLQTFLSSSQYVTCVETYLEDEGQLDLVVKYLQGVYQEVGAKVLRRTNGDRIRFILDVLLPEAIICAISAVDEVDYKTAEEKYIKGPSLSYREKEIFDNQLLEERKRRRW
nr:PWWP domain-containing DNA repair factor 3A isoform X5 [Macaca fascicularis]